LKRSNLLSVKFALTVASSTVSQAVTQLLSFAYATIMSLHFRWGWLWFLFACIVGLSRILTNAHWWHDVTGGAALGYLIAIGLAKWLKWGQGARGGVELEGRSSRRAEFIGKSRRSVNRQVGDFVESANLAGCEVR